MTPDRYFPFVLFVIAMTGTPGAGNLGMMAIGQSTGFRSALPFLAGTTAGALTLNTAVSLGLGSLIQAHPTFALIMKVCCTGYILYLAWKLLSMQLGSGNAEKRFTFVEGLFLHPLNPKSWAMSMTGITMIATPGADLATQAACFVLTFMVFQVGFHSLWGWAGGAMLRTLRSPSVLAGVNIGLVTAMVGATFYALFA